MDLSQLGQVGEFVGGVAVIGSLIYVGLQVHRSSAQAARQNQIALNASNQAAQRHLTTIFLTLCKDPDLSKIWRRGLNEFYTMTKDEQMRLNLLLTALIVQYNGAWMATRSDLVDPSFVETSLGVAVGLLRTPGGRQWWSEAKPFFQQDFVEFLSELDRRGEPVPVLTDSLSWYAADAPSPQGA